jgi:hypothetical protein
MLADHRFVRSAAARITAAADAICAGFAEGLVESPSAFTERLARQAARRLDGFRDNDLRWAAQAFVSADASRSPADSAPIDLVGTLEVALPDYAMRKGFLARVLLVAPGAAPDRAELEALRAACAAMLERTPASYVFLARRRGVIVVPAGAVAGSVGRPDRLHRRRIGRFYEEHFSCFIGDPGVSGESHATLEERVRAAGARVGLALRVEHATSPRQESLFRR